ncbi:dynamin family protein [Bacillus sp. JJ634]
MNQLQPNNNFLQDITYHVELSYEYDFIKIAQKFEILLEDIEQDTYTFVVVGEFSTGKSSFLNALIEQDILPTGVTPTTATINIVKYGEEDRITINKFDGTKLFNTDTDVLKDFIAMKIEQAEEIDTIEIERPIAFLKPKIVLVDTPGLNDVNALRSDITYQYIPRADVVFYLLDCRRPLRSTEYEFISETLLAQGLNRIIFVANFADEVDEDELDGIVTRIERQIKEGTSLSEAEVIPFSALEAIDAIEEQDEELYHLSGMPKVKERIDFLRKAGSRQQEKQQRFEQRFSFLREELFQALEQKKGLLMQSTDELRLQMQQLSKWQAEQTAFLEQLRDYTEERVNEFKQMAAKSIDTFFNEVEEELIDRIELYQGQQVQVFFEKEIPNVLKRKMKLWIERYNPHIHELIGKLETALIEILAETFESRVTIKQLRVNHQVSNVGQVELSVGKQHDPLLTSGLIVGGASTLFLVLGGPILLPILGMVGLPYLQRKMQKDQLEKLKPQMKADLTVQLQQIQFDFTDEVQIYIDKSCQRILEQCVLMFKDRIMEQEQIVQQQLQSRETNTEQNKTVIDRIDTLLQNRYLLAEPK